MTLEQTFGPGVAVAIVIAILLISFILELISRSFYRMESWYKEGGEIGWKLLSLPFFLAFGLITLIVEIISIISAVFLAKDIIKALRK